MSPDDEMVRRALEDPELHVRVRDQGVDLDQLKPLLHRVPTLVPFGGNRYARARAIVDWDHQLPSQHLLLRVFTAYSEHEASSLDTLLRARREQIDGDNLYPEFDLPDFGEIEASETYAGVFRPGAEEFDDFRFYAPWRKEVRPASARAAVAAVKQLDGFKEALRARKNESLGSAVVVGWAPPCLAHSKQWAVEVWLLTEFDGQAGKAMVYMVDSESEEVTREYETDVHLA